MKINLKSIFLRSIGLVLIAVLVELIGKPLGVKLTESIASIYHLIVKANLLNDLFITIGRFLIGFFIAAITAIPLGVLIGRIKTLYLILEFPIETLRPIPSAVVIPFGLALLGVGANMKIFVIWYGAFWPLLLYTLSACRHVDPILIEVADIFHIGKYEKLKSVILPAAVPSIIAGTRVSMGIALLLAVTVEMIAGGNPNGIGFFIIDSERSFRQDYMIAGVIVLAIFGYLVNFIFVKIEIALKSKRYNYLKEVISEK